MFKSPSREIINDEIKKNGNTNLITHSGLKSGSQIFAVGDSHTIFFYNSMKIIEHYGYECKIPITIYGLLKNGLNIYEIGNTLGNLHELYNIKQGDYVIFYYGFNDIQRSIHLHYKNNWEHGIDTIFCDYVNYINLLRTTYNIKPIISCIYPNPRKNACNQNPAGSYEERIKYTNHANKTLQKYCYTNQISFLDIYNYITDEDGFIKKELTNDNIHLDYNNEELRTFVENNIYVHCS